MKKQNFVKITKGHAIITIHFENPKKLSLSSMEKKHKNLSLLQSDIGGLRIILLTVSVNLLPPPLNQIEG